jgi:hypothetical protein
MTLSVCVCVCVTSCIAYASLTLRCWVFVWEGNEIWEIPRFIIVFRRARHCSQTINYSYPNSLRTFLMFHSLLCLNLHLSPTFTFPDQNSACFSFLVHPYCKTREFIVAYRPVPKQWLSKQQPLLGNARNTHTTIEEQVFYVVRCAIVAM